MPLIAHLSDLHFGRLRSHMIDPLRYFLSTRKPDLTTISGDLTQRAGKKEFLAAHQFIASLPGKTLTVPGNHDVPIYNVYERLFRPMARYKNYIHPETEPVFIDDNLLVMGVNTAHGWTTHYGKITLPQLLHIERLVHQYPGRTNILVSHHPFHVAQKKHERQIPRGSARIMRILIRSGIDLFLSGHIHQFASHVITLEHHKTHATSVFAHSGTTLAKHLRGEPPSFNLVTITHPMMNIDHIVWREDIRSFSLHKTYHFLKGTSGWNTIE